MGNGIGWLRKKKRRGLKWTVTLNSLLSFLTFTVIPAKAGISLSNLGIDSCFRRNDSQGACQTFNYTVKYHYSKRVLCLFTLFGTN